MHFAKTGIGTQDCLQCYFVIICSWPITTKVSVFGNCPPTQGVCWQLVIVYSLIFLSICSGTELLRSTEGTFYTPNWPLTYPSSTTCSWTFYPPEGKTVLLFFMSFEMEGKFECKASRPSVTGDEIRVNGG